MKLITLATALILTIPAIANAQDSIVIHTVSKHANKARDKAGTPYNEVNPGIALRRELDNGNAVQIGVYRNSHDRTSVYGGFDYLPVKLGSVKAGLFIGAATGYPMGAVTPMGGLTMRVDGNTVGIAVRIAPPTPKSSAVAALEISFKL